MTKAYDYGGPAIGQYNTRHDAVGVAAIVGRKDNHIRQAPFDGPKEAVRLVTPISTAICGYCRETFERYEALAEHKPCPHYIEAREL